MDVRKLLPLVLCLLQLVVLVYFGYLGVMLPTDNRLERFAVANQAAEQRYETFASEFNDRERFLVVIRHQQGDTPIGPSGEAIFDIIAALPQIHARYSASTLGLQSPEQSPFPFVNVAQRLYTALFIIEADRDALLRHLEELTPNLVAEYEDVAEIMVVGEPVVNDLLNRGSLEVRTVFFPILIACALVLIALLFRDWKVLVVTAFAVGTGLANTMGVLYLAGQSMDLVTTLIPALIFVLAVAMQMHVLICMGSKGSIWEGLRQKVGPNCIVSLTTSIGFGSLMVSEVRPIAVMGQYMAIGIWLIFFWTHVTHLGISRVIDLQVRSPRLSLLTIAVESRWYASWRARPWWLVTALVVIAAGAWVLATNPIESNGLNYFDEKDPIRVQTAFLERHVTGASQLELLVSKSEDGVPPWDRLAAWERELLAMPHIRHLVSPRVVADLASLQAGGFVNDRTLLFSLARNTQPDLVEPFESERFYRIQIMVESLDRETYEALRDRIESSFHVSGIGGELIVTGILDRLVEIQRYLLKSLSLSLSLTIAAILVLMMLILGHGRVSAILIPNLFPLGAMALAMWVFGIKTSISSVMVFSIAFGIAVDDTIHLLHTFHHGNADQPFEHRWRCVLGQDARAILLTSLVLSVGFSVLILSGFGPTVDFGILMGVGMVTAFLGDMLYLPLLLRRWKLCPEDRKADP